MVDAASHHTAVASIWYLVERERRGVKRSEECLTFRSPRRWPFASCCLAWPPSPPSPPASTATTTTTTTTTRELCVKRQKGRDNDSSSSSRRCDHSSEGLSSGNGFHPAFPIKHGHVSHARARCLFAVNIFGRSQRFGPVEGEGRLRLTAKKKKKQKKRSGFA